MDSQPSQSSPQPISTASSLGPPEGLPEGAKTLSSKKKSRRGADPASQKRRCVSTACIACRKRKSKCDGALPSCAACASVYGTECLYDPNSDHRRKGVYREKIDSMKARNSTLQILVEAILNAAEEDVPAIVTKMRTCDSLDDVAESLLKEEKAKDDFLDEEIVDEEDDFATEDALEGERELARKMGELRLENGAVRFIGGTSHLIYLGDPTAGNLAEPESESFQTNENPITTWSEVTKDTKLIVHLMDMYFNWHYTYFTTLSKSLFYRDYLRGKHARLTGSTAYCSSLLVNAMLALGCHFTDVEGAFAVQGDSRTKGDHFFAEAKRLIVENDEYEKPRLTTVQALALMSVREAGCGREAKGWVYSGMSFRMAQDIGLNLDTGGLAGEKDSLTEQEIDARRITFWGCFLFDKCWSNYLGRLPQLPKNSYSVPKYDVFPDEDAELWSPYTDAGFYHPAGQPSRTRAIGLQLSKLCEISSDVLLFFYHPNNIGRSSGKAVELKKLSELQRRLEDWRRELPKELEAKDGQLPNMILTHMFFHLQYIHLFRPFLKYAPSASPLPAYVSPRRICTANAGAISKLMRLYKKTYNMRQICNIAVYMVQSACTIHMLNLPEKTAKRDIIHSVKHLEEIAEDWLCARRALGIISVLARKWGVDMPEEATVVLQRTDEKYGTFSTSDVPSPEKLFTISHGSTSSPVAIQGSPASSKQEGYSPTQFTHPAGPGVPDVPPGNTAPELMASLAAMSGMPAGVAGQPGSPKSLVSHPVTGATMPLSDALADMNAWSMPHMAPQQQQQMQDFQRSYLASQNRMQQQQQSGSGAGATPVSMFGVDGDSWFLRDSANWQQNFETWDMGPQQQQQQQPMSSSTGPSGSSSGGVNSPGGGGGGGGLQHPAMYMFKGLRSADLDAALESFNSSMGVLNPLQDLD